MTTFQPVKHVFITVCSVIGGHGESSRLARVIRHWSCWIRWIGLICMRLNASRSSHTLICCASFFGLTTCAAFRFCEQELQDVSLDVFATLERERSAVY